MMRWILDTTVVSDLRTLNKSKSSVLDLKFATWA